MEIVAFFQIHIGVFVTVVALFGLMFGSFINVIVYRLPIMMQRDWRDQCAHVEGCECAKPEADEGTFNLWTPRSTCPRCGHRISALQNVPVVSYLLLRGRCAHCAAPIGIRYPAVELVAAVLGAIVAYRFGASWEAVVALSLTWSLVALSGIDIDHQLLPDSITLPLLWLGLIMSLFHGRAPGDVLFVDPGTAIIGAVAGYLTLWSVYQLFKLLTGKEGMGYGDFKLLAVLGAWLGWKMLPLIILLSAAVGAIVGIALIVFGGRGRQIPIPFGPYLAAAGWVALIWGQDIVNLYLGISGF